MLWRYIESLPAPASVLHVAPEPQLSRRLRALAPTYVSVDLEQPADLKADITVPLPFPDESFDLIICSHVLEHIPDDGAAIHQLARLLSPDGALLVLVPVFASDTTVEDVIDDPAERLRVYGQADHVRAYGRDVIHRLREPGLDVLQISLTDFPADERERMRLGQPIKSLAGDEMTGDIYVCRRGSR